MTPDTLYRVWFVTDRVARYEKLDRFSDILKHDSEEIKDTKQTRQVMTLTQVELIRLKAGYSILLLTIRPEETLECRYAMMRIEKIRETSITNQRKTAIDKCLSKLRFLHVELRIWTRGKLFRQVLKLKKFNKNHLTVPHSPKHGKTDWYETVKGDLASLPSNPSNPSKKGSSLRLQYIRKNKDANANSSKTHYISRHIIGEEGLGLNSAFVLWKMIYKKTSYDKYYCNNNGCKAFELPTRIEPSDYDSYGPVCKVCKKRVLTFQQLTYKLRARFQPTLEDNLTGIRRDKDGNIDRGSKTINGVSESTNHSGHGHQIPAWEAEKMVKAFFGENHTTELDNLGLYA